MEPAKILVADDDEWIRQTIKRAMVKEGYTVIEASNGEECLSLFKTHQPDLILLDAILPVLDGFTTCERLQQLPKGSQTPVLMITSLDDHESVDRAFMAGASDFLTKPIHWAVLRQRVRRMLITRQIEGMLEKKITELDILNGIDRELGFTMNIQRILELAAETALRLSKASACVIGWIEEETQQIEPLARVGETSIMTAPLPRKQLAQLDPFLASVFEGKDAFYYRHSTGSTQLVLPLLNQNKPDGVMILDTITDSLAPNDLEFLIHLANRTAAALDRTRAYQKIHTHANHIDNLYVFSTSISAHIHRSEVIELLTRGLTVLLKATSGFFCDYDEASQNLIVQNRFVMSGVSDTPPAAGARYPMLPNITAFSQLATTLDASEGNANDAYHDWHAALKKSCHIQAGLLVPVIYEDHLLGLVVLGDSRFERYFLPDEIGLVHSLAAHGAVALQQATLFKNIQELERTKSDMIRMISHDLRNPLSQVSNYFALLLDDIGHTLAPEQQSFATHVTKGIKTIETLLTDILSLERVENENRTAWEAVDIHRLVEEVTDTLAPQAALKEQSFLAALHSNGCVVLGNRTQLRQALTNLIDNAIKFTPQGGTIEVRSTIDEDKRFQFAVEDNGYGIKTALQDRLFERFYRAVSPGTEHIDGTGLGLSLVKTVVEQHSGKVWLESEMGVGSTFGFWLPTVQDNTL